MRRKNLLYLGNALSHKGITVTTIDTLSRQLRAEGYEVEVASSYKNKGLRLLDMLWQVYKHRSRVDMVLIDTYSTTNFWYAVYVAKLCRMFRLPYIPILHGGNLPERLKSNPSTSEALFGKAFMNVAPSGYLYNVFTQAGFTNLKEIPNTIDITEYPFKERRHVGPKLLWVRAFAEIYNPMLALKVLQKLRKTYPDVSLCMVGPEKDESYMACKIFAQEHQLPVSFTGKLAKAEWILISKDYDLFINTTNFDNTPVSVIEAMALGLPVVSTNVGGLSYLLSDRENALLVPPNSVEEMANEIGNLLQSETLGHQLSLAARSKAEGFDWEIVKSFWNELLST
jgi:glycosyltransferase involved in cell wall biosynthesis